MTVSSRTRFEVFKRDRFTCQYCGKNPPDVLLECDHIIPRAAGGTDEITNLTTACKECNAGKSDRLLEEGTAPAVSRSVVDDLRERLEQAAAYTELVGQQTNLIEKQRNLIFQYWAKSFRAKTVEQADGAYWHFDDGSFPNERSVRIFIRRMPVNEILAAVDIAASRHDHPTDWACRLFYKLCWRRIKGESGPIEDGAAALDTHAECNEMIDHYRSQWMDAVELDVKLRDQIGELEQTIADLQVTIRRFREETGRE